MSFWRMLTSAIWTPRPNPPKPTSKPGLCSERDLLSFLGMSVFCDKCGKPNLDLRLAGRSAYRTLGGKREATVTSCQLLCWHCGHQLGTLFPCLEQNKEHLHGKPKDATRD